MRTFKWTVLNITSTVFIVGVLLYTVANYGALSAGEGWGVAGMFGLIVLGLIGFAVDFVLRIFIKDRKRLNIIEAGALIIFAAIILLNYWKSEGNL